MTLRLHRTEEDSKGGAPKLLPTDEYFIVKLPHGGELRLPNQTAIEIYYQLDNWIKGTETKRREVDRAKMAVRKQESDTFALQLLGRYREVIATRLENSSAARQRAAWKQLAQETGRPIGEIGALLRLAKILTKRRTRAQVEPLIRAGMSNAAIARLMNVADATVAKIRATIQGSKQ